MKIENHHIKYYSYEDGEYHNGERVGFYRHNHIIQHLLQDVRHNRTVLAQMFYELVLLDKYLDKAWRCCISHLRPDNGKWYVYDYHLTQQDIYLVKSIVKFFEPRFEGLLTEELKDTVRVVIR